MGKRIPMSQVMEDEFRGTTVEELGRYSLDDAYTIANGRVFTYAVRGVANVPSRCVSADAYSVAHKTHQYYAVRYAEDQLTAMEGGDRPRYEQVTDILVTSGAFDKARDLIKGLLDANKLDAEQAAEVLRQVQERISFLEQMRQEYYLVRNEPEELDLWRRYEPTLAAARQQMVASDDAARDDARAAFLRGRMTPESMEMMRQINPEVYQRMQQQMQR